MVGVLVMALVACSGERAGGAREALGVGTDDDGDPAVVALVSAQSAAEVRCTGTLIAPQVVLTAAHCGAQNEPDAIEVLFGNTLLGSGTRVPIVAAVAHPELDDTADHDVALLLLRDAAGAEPLALVAGSVADAPQSVRIVGFGMTAPGASDAYRKREGRSRITEVTPAHVVLGADPSLPCNGDSGGPVLAATASGEELVAVISRGDAECNAVSRATRVDVQVETFIGPTLEAWAAGSVSLGARCLYDAHCESGRCLEAIDEPLASFCSRACATDDDCAAPLVCAGGQCRHALPSPGAVGAACIDHDDCVRGDCLDGRGICSTRCVSGREGDCASGFACTHLGGSDFHCLPQREPPSDEGCAIAHAEGSTPDSGQLPTGVLLCALVALAMRATQRRQSLATPVAPTPDREP